MEIQPASELVGGASEVFRGLHRWRCARRGAGTVLLVAAVGAIVRPVTSPRLENAPGLKMDDGSERITHY